MTEPETGRLRLRKALPVILIVAAFLVPAGTGLAVGASLLSGTTAAPMPTPSTSQTPSDGPQPEAVEPFDFSSVSGNLRCHMDAASAWCHQAEYKYVPTYDNCAVVGVAVGVTTKEAYWPCVPVRPALSPSVAYDTPVVRGEFTCVINLKNGARCTNSVGAGFTIEYSAGVTTF